MSLTCAKLAAAILSAAPGATLTLAPGQDCAAIKVAGRVWDKPVTINAKGATVRGLTLEGVDGLNWLGGTLRASGGLTGKATSGYAVRVRKSANITIRDAMFTDAARGLVAGFSDRLLIASNRFQGLRSDGINLAATTRVQLLDNRIRDFTPNKRRCVHDGGMTMGIARRDCPGVWTDGDHPDAIQMWGDTDEVPLLKGGIGGNATNLQGTPLPPAKFIFHLHPAKSGLPIRGGLARAAAWAYLFKNYSLKDWVAFCEIYGRPFRIGKYPAGSTPEQIETLMMAVAGMGEDAAAVIPDSMMIELIDSKVQGGDLYDRLLNYLDRQMSKAVLGQTATTDADTGGLGSGREHGEVRADIERADARLLAASIQRDLFVPMVRLNFGEDAAIPKLRIGREEEWDVGRMMPAIRSFVDMGGRVEKSIIADRLGLPDAPADAEVLGAAADGGADAAPGQAEIRPLQRQKGASGVADT